MMVLDRRGGKISHYLFRDLPSFLSKGDALVLNETRVMPARFFGKTPTGASIEFLLIEFLNNREIKGLVKGLKKMKPGQNVDFGNGLTGKFSRREEDYGVFSLSIAGKELNEWIEKNGHMPLPPYIERSDEELDKKRYQTVFAKHDGSCAAPTAGLHFTGELLEEIEKSGTRIFRICLHIGPATFRPITTDDITAHRLESEYADVPGKLFGELMKIKSDGGRVITVGTSTTRALETSALYGGSFRGKTDLYIRPPFNFRITDGLVTNFHLPGSSLLVMVSAFAGREKVLKAYQEAINMEYRFYSYGDAMLII